MYLSICLWLGKYMEDRDVNNQRKEIKEAKQAQAHINIQNNIYSSKNKFQKKELQIT